MSDNIVSDLLGKTVRVSRELLRSRYDRIGPPDVVVTVGRVRAVAVNADASMSLLIEVHTSKAESAPVAPGMPSARKARVRQPRSLFVANVKTDDVTVEDEA